MEPIEAAILRTVMYADVFDFPLTIEEIHHFLIHDGPVSLEHTRKVVESSQCLRNILVYEQGHVVPRGREGLIAVRRERDQSAARLWPLALRYGIWLARLPFVRMVALTGALAVRNVPDGDDDIDYLLVTAPGRVWVARAFAVVLVRLARILGSELCPNYVLAENSLEQARQDIFVAHELAQMVPLYGYEVYRRMRAINRWSEAFLPNAIGVFHVEDELTLGRFWAVGKRLAEILLGGRLGAMLETWECRRKIRRFGAAMRNPNSSAQIDETQVKGHFNDNGRIALREFRARLRKFGMDEVSVSVPGD